MNGVLEGCGDATVASKRRIVTALADGAASVSELAEKFECDPNGHLSADLKELTVAGFVAASEGLNPKTGRAMREVRYRLSDNYTRFYLIDSVAPYFRRGTRGGEGVQIDMLVQLPKCVYVVETKRRNDIGVEIEAEVQDKINRLPIPKGKSVKTVLVYDGTIAPELEEDGFFDFIVPADRLLR